MKSGVKVVVVTASASPMRRRARQAGADLVFTKPLDWSLLRARLIERNEALAAA
jgi:CheY-like chemotaxis protein